MKLGLFDFSQPLNFERVEGVIACQVGPVGHSVYAYFGYLDCFHPDAELPGIEAAEPRAGWTPVACFAASIDVPRFEFDFDN